MTELLEKVAIDFGNSLKDKLQCDEKKATSKGGKVRITGVHGVECTAEQLRSNLEAATKKGAFIPNDPKKKKGTTNWDLEDCKIDTYPSQAHHLISKKYLPTHRVCVWLTKDPPGPKDPPYSLENDTSYDTDDWRNGYCMPFASTTAQWIDANGNAKKQEYIAFRMMYLTQKQLHQGSHSSRDYFEEEEGIEKSSYKDAMKRLLDVVADRASKHAKVCEPCKKDGENKLRPREEVVDHMHGVSGILRTLIDKQEIFVSRRAANFHAAQLAKQNPGQ